MSDQQQDYLRTRLLQAADYHVGVAKHAANGWHDDMAVTLGDAVTELSRLQGENIRLRELTQDRYAPSRTIALEEQLAALRLEIDGDGCDGSHNPDPVVALGLRKCLVLQREQIAALRDENTRLKDDIYAFNKHDHDREGAAEVWHDLYREALDQNAALRAEQCAKWGHCACDVCTRHEWFDAFCDEREAYAALREQVTQIEQEWPHEHKKSCPAPYCGECGQAEWASDHQDYHAANTAYHNFKVAPCTCGLSDALALLVGEKTPEDRARVDRQPTSERRPTASKE